MSETTVQTGLVCPFTVYEFIAVTVNLKNVTKGVFHVNHAIWLFARVIIARLFHPLFTTGSDNSFSKFLDIWILDTKMKHAGFPILKVVLRVFLVRKLK
jgi:hypothetical protein